MGRVIRPEGGSPLPRRRPRPEPTAVISRAQQVQRQAAEDQVTQAQQKAAGLLAEAEAAATARRAELLAGAEMAASRLLLDAQQMADRLVQHEQGRLAALAVHIAEKILGEQLSLAPEKVTAVVAQAIKGVAASQRVRIRVHPEDVAAVRRATKILQDAQPAARLHLEGDRTIGRGGCLLETERGLVDGQIPVQLSNILRLLRNP